VQRRTLITAAAAAPLAVAAAGEAEADGRPEARSAEDRSDAKGTGTARGPKPTVPGPGLAELVAKLTGPDSINETDTRYQVHGTDLGTIWDNGSGQVLLAFGDTFGEGQVGGGEFGEDRRSNVPARSSDRDLSDGLHFDDMAVDRPGHAKELLASKKVDKDEITVIPNSGVSVGDRQFLHYFSQYTWDPSWTTAYGGIAYSDDNGEDWTKSDVRWENPEPLRDRYFQLGALLRHDGHVYLFGTRTGRLSAIKLARVAEDDVLDMRAWRYWNGHAWTPDEERAIPVAAAPSGEMSVQYNAYLGRWVMMYLNEYRSAIVLREAYELTGPWSGERVVVRGEDHPALYAPFMHPWSAASGEPDLYFVMSQWGPYNVFLMRTRLDRDVDTGNLLGDPGFEEQPDEDGVAVPWRLCGRGGIDRGLGFARSGENNAFVRASQGWNALTQPVVVRPERTYRLTAWVRSSQRAVPHGALGVRGPSGVIAQTTFGHLADYTRLTVDFRSGSTTDIEVFAGFWGPGDDAWVQIDDMELRER